MWDFACPYMHFTFYLCVMHHQHFLMQFSGFFLIFSNQKSDWIDQSTHDRLMRSPNHPKMWEEENSAASSSSLIISSSAALFLVNLGMSKEVVNLQVNYLHGKLQTHVWTPLSSRKGHKMLCKDSERCLIVAWLSMMTHTLFSYIPSASTLVFWDWSQCAII